MLEEILIKVKWTLHVKNQVNTNIFRFLTGWKVKRILNRKINPLLRIPDKFETILITTENHDFSKEGVKHLNIIDFLCGDEV